MTSWMSRLTRSRWTVPWAAFNLILLCFLWKPSFEKCQEPHVYYRYVDATFSFIISIKVAKAFQLALNSFHRSLWFIMDVEYDSSSHFWDVCLLSGRTVLSSLVLIVNIHWNIHQLNAFISKSRKINLISTFAHRALIISSICKLDGEMENIYSIFRGNGYP